MIGKPCTRCGLTQKAPGKQRCHECLVLELPPAAQEQDAARRLRCIPLELRQARVPERDWPIGRRWCSGCQSFIRTQDCTGSRCKVCAGRAAWEAMLPRTYRVGLPDGSTRPFTAEDYWLLYEACGGRCPICHRRVLSKRMAVDHDHETGLVRGLLDPDPEWGCNHAILGKIKDLAMAKRIVSFLEDPPAQQWITE